MNVDTDQHYQETVEAAAYMIFQLKKGDDRMSIEIIIFQISKGHDYMSILSVEEVDHVSSYPLP